MKKRPETSKGSMANLLLKPPSILNQEAEVMMLGYGKEPYLGLKSLPEFTRIPWGYGKGRVIIIGARTSQGKSAFLAQNSFDLASQGYKVVMLSLEMSESSLWMRNFCREMKIDNYDILRGGFPDMKDKWETFKSKTKIKIMVSDCVGKDWKEVNSIIESMPTQKPDVIIIDHINDIRLSGNNDRAIMDDYILNIRRIAIHNGITFLIGAQINRAAQDDKDQPPQLHHLKGTGKLEEAADMVVLLHWPYFYDKTKDIEKYLLLIAKNRHGKTDYKQVNFYPQFSLFKEVEQVEEYSSKFKKQETVKTDWREE